MKDPEIGCYASSEDTAIFMLRELASLIRGYTESIPVDLSNDQLLEVDASSMLTYGSLLDRAGVVDHKRRYRYRLYRKVVDGFPVFESPMHSIRRAIEHAIDELDRCTTQGEMRVGSKKSLEEFCHQVHQSILNSSITPNDAARLTTLFVFTMFFQHVIRFRRKHESIRCSIRPTSIDASFLESIFFGSSTGSAGLDFVLGGGGLILGRCDSPLDGIPRRNVCLAGKPAVGKTSFAISMCAAVARSGGVCVYASLDSGSSNARYLLSSLGLHGPKDGFYTATDTDSTFDFLSQLGKQESGLIAFLTLDRESLPKALKQVEQFCRRVKEKIHRNRVLLAVIDPINSLLLTGDHHKQKLCGETGAVDVAESKRFSLREDLLSCLEALNTTGFNTLNCLEQSNGQSYLQVEAVSDTVINLDKSSNGGGSRTLSVTKSRRQREFSGTHDFRIDSKYGIVVYPNLSSIAAVDRKRRHDCKQKTPWAIDSTAYSTFGLESFDTVLRKETRRRKKSPLFGKGSIGRGDIILLQGPLGTFKTHLALSFCHWFSRDDVAYQSSRIRKHPRSQLAKIAPISKVGMIISLRVNDLRTRTANPVYIKTLTARNATIAAELNIEEKEAKRLFGKELVTCLVPGPFVGAAELMSIIDEAISNERLSGKVVDRVLIDCPSDWDDLCPGIARTNGFAQTLLTNLNYRGITTIVTERFARETSPICRTVRKMADTVIYLNSFKDQSTNSAFVRVVKSKLMQHDPNEYPFESSSQRGLFVNLNSDFLRFSLNEAPAMRVKAAAFLPVENNQQLAQCKRIETIIKSATGIEFNVSAANTVEIDRLIQLAMGGKKDEIQIVGIEDFQGSDFFDAYIKRNTNTIPNALNRTRNERNFLVRKLSNNFGVLLKNIDCATQSWSEVAKGVSENEFKFRYVFRHREDFNGLYLELLVSQIGKDAFEEAALQGVDEIIKLGDKIKEMLCLLMPSHLRVSKISDVNEGAPTVIRKWFSNEFDNRQSWRQSALPAGIATSGDWNAAVLKSSSSTKTASQILDTICTMFDPSASGGDAAHEEIAKDNLYRIHRSKIRDYPENSARLFQAIQSIVHRG